LSAVEVTGPSAYVLDNSLVDTVRGRVRALCQRFPIQ
jgi:hypothetical protein